MKLSTNKSDDTEYRCSHRDSSRNVLSVKAKFDELKKCKTIKEIYMIIGLDAFEKPAFILLCIWAMLPVWSIWSHFYWGIRTAFSDMRTGVIWNSYQNSVLFVGEFTLALAVLYLIGVLILDRRAFFGRLKKSPWNVCLLAMLGWAVLSTVFSEDISRSLQGSAYRFEGILTYFFYASVFVLAQIVHDPRWKEIYYKIFCVCACIISVSVILQDAGVPGVKDVLYIPLASVFFQFNHTGYYLCMSTLCTMGLLLFAKNVRQVVLYAFAVFLQMYALLVNSTLGGYLGVFVGLVAFTSFVFVGCRKREHYRSIRTALFVAIGVFALTTALSYFDLIPTSSGQNMRVNFATMWDDTEKLASGNGDSAGHGRVTLWKTGLAMLPIHPVLGFGPENMDKELQATIWNDRIDNEVLQYAIYLGIPAALLYLAALFTLAFSRGASLPRLRPAAFVAAGCVFGYLLSSMLGNSMFYTAPYFWIFLGIVADSHSVEA